MAVRRVALVGLALESNSFAPVATEDDFRHRCYLQGDRITDEAAKDHPAMAAEMASFIGAMTATGTWQPVPIFHFESQPKGPVDQGFFEWCLDEITRRFDETGPVDGVYIANHGAMTATGDSDPDGTMFRHIRDIVGPDVPIVATLDLHGNVSSRMVAAVDVMVSYLTNPHVDMIERGEEAAFAMRRIFAGMRPRSVFIRLPLAPASINLLTAGGPYGELIDFGQRRQREFGGAILNVSILGGFVFSDTPDNGIAIVVTARADEDTARNLAIEIADKAWRDRARYRKSMTPFAKGVSMAVQNGLDAKARSLIFADSGDNPGGGGSGATTEFLIALVAAGAKGVLYGSFFDPTLAEEAHGRGLGAAFDAEFNRNGGGEHDRRCTFPAKVAGLTDGRFVGRLGLFAGRTLDLGPCCLLELGGAGGVRVVVVSNRQQTADPGFFEMFGLDVAEARTVIVKSRGHFRAGFVPWFPPERVFEIDTKGLTSPVLENFEWKGLPRPVYPLDEDVDWQPPQ